MKKILLLSLIILSSMTIYAQSSEDKQSNYNIVLHTPDYMNSYISVSVIFDQDATAYIGYNEDDKTAVKFFTANQPQDFLLTRLSRKGSNSYKLFYSFDGGQTILESPLHEFVYPSKNNEEFCFTISSFSTLFQDKKYDAINTSIERIKSQKPLFHVDLGNNFMVSNYNDDYKQSVENFLNCRTYLGQLSSYAPLYLVQGDKDGQAGKDSNAVTAWSKIQKQTMFPSLYTENYYSFTYGEAQIIVLDPFANTPVQGDKDAWARTLGKDQYEWLKTTLKKSKAQHKFVFIHDLFGSENSEQLYEWGGKSANGNYDFDSKRKGWKRPIHTLLKENDVNAVFYVGGNNTTTKKLDEISYVAISNKGFFKVIITPEGVQLSNNQSNDAISKK